MNYRDYLIQMMCKCSSSTRRCLAVVKLTIYYFSNTFKGSFVHRTQVFCAMFFCLWLLLILYCMSALSEHSGAWARVLLLIDSINTVARCACLHIVDSW